MYVLLLTILYYFVCQGGFQVRLFMV